MTNLSPDTLPLIADRLRLFGTVTLSSETAHELLHRAAQSYRQELVLNQIAQGNGQPSEWARRVIADDKRDRPKLKHPSRLVKIEIA